MINAIMSRYCGVNYFDKSIEGFVKTLFKLPRFVGWGKNTFSVGQHSYHVYLLAKERYPTNTRLQLLAAVHDFPEAFYGDIPSFIKHNLHPDTKSFLWAIDRDIYDMIGVDYPLSSEEEKVKELDLIALTREAKFIFQEDFKEEDWPKDDTSLTDYLVYDSSSCGEYFSQVINKLKEQM